MKVQSTHRNQPLVIRVLCVPLNLRKADLRSALSPHEHGGREWGAKHNVLEIQIFRRRCL